MTLNPFLLAKIFSDEKFREIVKARSLKVFGQDCTKSRVQEIMRETGCEIISGYKKSAGVDELKDIKDFSIFASRWIESEYRKIQK
ncbi:hypothetical protein F1737_00510 [Methanoplanus sp. FWC-SCC4]|uniref:Uncharacterized protein n=1 Tax=Methanochimaera problematica TaxID=2609417 RepID=A0AA97F9D0_9EURY|nr:hypothetical protein [Methanoplanus sp. FWC-SCC4]WOF15265.1 hypothetical protein F1737_00510 [Methanoplanus sp. FWC-SCC4]